MMARSIRKFISSGSFCLQTLLAANFCISAALFNSLRAENSGFNPTDARVEKAAATNQAPGDRKPSKGKRKGCVTDITGHTECPQRDNQFQSANMSGVKPDYLAENCHDYGAGKDETCHRVCFWDADPVKDDDFARNCAAIVEAGLQFRTVEFNEGGRNWILQIGINPQKPEGPLWFVPHDNENVAFDTAIYALTKYGGKLIKVQTKGQRENAGQDPNRNFQIEGAAKCKDQRALSPEYTKAILSEWDGLNPLVALHSNKPGGYISIRTKMRDATASPGVRKGGKLFSLFRPDNTLVFLSATEKPARTEGFRKALNANGVNVIMERVNTENNDCSLSNYAVLSGIEIYFNVEVGNAPRQRNSQSEQAQKAIVDLIVNLPGVRNPKSQRESAR